jgi:hypothetical protein
MTWTRTTITIDHILAGVISLASEYDIRRSYSLQTDDERGTNVGAGKIQSRLSNPALSEIFTVSSTESKSYRSRQRGAIGLSLFIVERATCASANRYKICAQQESDRMKMRSNSTKKITALATAAASLLMVNGGFAAIPVAIVTSPADAFHYADIADLFAGAPIVLRAKIVSVTALKGPPNPGGVIRFYVEGDVVALIRGVQAVPTRLIWLVDMRPDSRGKIPKLRKADVLIAALPVPGRPGELRLAARDAQVFWSPALETRVRNVVASVAAPESPPAISGVASAFHTAGTVTGEGETQIFLSTVTKAPISLSVLTRPGQPKRWAFALGEIVDEAAGPPAPDTLAWYRLACFLPRALPEAAVSALPAADADAARGDYAFVVQALGACPRVRS